LERIYAYYAIGALQTLCDVDIDDDDDDSGSDQTTKDIAVSQISRGMLIHTGDSGAARNFRQGMHRTVALCPNPHVTGPNVSARNHMCCLIYIK